MQCESVSKYLLLSVVTSDWEQMLAHKKNSTRNGISSYFVDDIVICSWVHLRSCQILLSALPRQWTMEPVPQRTRGFFKWYALYKFTFYFTYFTYLTWIVSADAAVYKWPSDMDHTGRRREHCL